MEPVPTRRSVYWPTAQAVHCVDASVSTYVPGAHCLQPDAVVWSWKVPDVHSSHSVAEPSEGSNLPSTHAMHSVDAVAVWYFPFWHDVHSVCPVCA